MLQPVGDSRTRPPCKSGRVFAGVIDDALADGIVEGSARVCQEYGKHDGRDRKQTEGCERHRMVGETILFHGAVGAGRHSSEGSQYRADQQQPQAHAHAPSHFLVDRAAVDRVAEVPPEYPANPAFKPLRDRRLVIEVERVEQGIYNLGRWRRVAAFKIRTGIQCGGGEKICRRCRDHDENNEIYESLEEKFSHSSNAAGIVPLSPCQDGTVQRGICFVWIPLPTGEGAAKRRVRGTARNCFHLVPLTRPFGPPSPVGRGNRPETNSNLNGTVREAAQGYNTLAHDEEVSTIERGPVSQLPAAGRMQQSRKRGFIQTLGIHSHHFQIECIT